MEAYISVVYATHRAHAALSLAFVGSLGQNVGKLVWYYVCPRRPRHPVAQAPDEHPQARRRSSSAGAATSRAGR